MTINLQAFCAKDDVRSYLMTPFVLDGHTCATNGDILVRVPGGDAGEAVMIAGSVRKLFADQYDDFEPLPAIPERVTCEDCDGTGKVENEECDDCRGRGEFWHGDYEYECQNCDGTGTTGPGECSKCHGHGEPLTLMQIGPANFQARYLRLIAALPNARISVPSATGVAAFVFDGGDGRLMPCRP